MYHFFVFEEARFHYITYTTFYDLFTVGAGYLDVWAALNNSDVLTAGKTAVSPAATYDALANKVTIGGTNVVWGDNVVFAGSGTTPGVGVPMVLISGRLAAERVLGKDLTYRSRAWR